MQFCHTSFFSACRARSYKTATVRRRDGPLPLWRELTDGRTAVCHLYVMWNITAGNSLPALCVPVVTTLPEEQKSVVFDVRTGRADWTAPERSLSRDWNYLPEA